MVDFTGDNRIIIRRQTKQKRRQTKQKRRHYDINNKIVSNLVDQYIEWTQKNVLSFEDL
jgi:hypothetical protein